MTLFYYLAVSNAGNGKTDGQIEAASENAARQELNRLGLSVLMLDAKPLEFNSGVNPTTQAFEFEATDKAGKFMDGTIDAADLIAAYDRLTDEFQFNTTYLCLASASAEEKQKARKAGITPILQTKAEQAMAAGTSKKGALIGGLENFIVREEKRLKSLESKPQQLADQPLEIPEPSPTIDSAPKAKRLKLTDDLEVPPVVSPSVTDQELENSVVTPQLEPEIQPEPSISIELDPEPAEQVIDDRVAPASFLARLSERLKFPGLSQLFSAPKNLVNLVIPESPADELTCSNDSDFSRTKSDKAVPNPKPEGMGSPAFFSQLLDKARDLLKSNSASEVTLPLKKQELEELPSFRTLCNQLIAIPSQKTRRQVWCEIKAVLAKQNSRTRVAGGLRKLIEEVHSAKIAENFWLIINSLTTTLAFCFFGAFVGALLVSRYEWGVLSEAAHRLTSETTVLPFFTFALILFRLVLLARTYFTTQRALRFSLLTLLASLVLIVTGINLL